MTELSDRQSRDQALFDAIASTYANKEFTAALSTARRHRLLQTLDRVNLAPMGTVLELGCGAGFAARYLDGQYRRYVGVDYSEQLIEFARRHNAVPRAEFFVGNVTELGLREQFDAAFMIGVLHHVVHPVEALRAVRQMLKPDGRIAVNEPSQHNPLMQVSRSIRALVSKNYSDEQIQYRASELEDQLRDAGFVDCEVFGQGIFSTPLAEVRMPMQSVMHRISEAACAVDRLLERKAQKFVRMAAWNVVAVGRNPSAERTSQA